MTGVSYKAPSHVIFAHSLIYVSWVELFSSETKVNNFINRYVNAKYTGTSSQSYIARQYTQINHGTGQGASMQSSSSRQRHGDRALHITNAITNETQDCRVVLIIYSNHILINRSF
jgi:hypothetical protein